MTPEEVIVIRNVERLTQARDASGVVALLSGEIDNLLAGARSRAFTGKAFDGYCRALLAADGHLAPTFARIRDLCDKSRRRFGDQPWTDLYEGSLSHLAGEDAAAAECYSRASREAEVLWGSSVGCRSVVSSRQSELYLSQTPALAPLRLVRRGASGRSTLMVGCDPAYLRRFGPAYLKSVNEHAAQCALHLHIIGHDEELSAWIQAQVPQLWPRVWITVEDYSGADTRAYFALARLIRLSEVLALHRQLVFMTDIDAAFTHPISPDLAALEVTADFFLRFKHTDFHHHPWNTIQANALLVRHTACGVAFSFALRSIAAGVFAERAGEGVWFIDQNALFATYRWSQGGRGLVGDLSRAPLPGGLVFGKTL